MSETKPCPACGHELKLPSEYFDALANMRKELEKFRSVIIEDLIRDRLKITAAKSTVAMVLLHYQRTIDKGIAKSPMPHESRMAYENNPVINKFTDSIVYGLLKLLVHNEK